MKRSEIISKYRDSISDTMRVLYRSVLESDGRIQYKLYVWEDGELELLEEPQGGNDDLQPRRHEPRELFYVDTITEGNPWDYVNDSVPDDDDERDKYYNELLDFLAGSYHFGLPGRIDDIIAEAEREEFFDTNNCQ